MDTELQRAYRIIAEQGTQISRLAKLLESQIALKESQTTILQTLVMMLGDRPDFRRILDEIHQVRLTYHLNQAVSDFFVAEYQDGLNAMLPKELRFFEMR